MYNKILEFFCTQSLGVQNTHEKENHTRKLNNNTHTHPRRRRRRRRLMVPSSWSSSSSRVRSIFVAVFVVSRGATFVKSYTTECRCNGESFLVQGVSLGGRCAEWGSKNEICVTQTSVTGNEDCCKPWCWVSEEDCPTARYNKEADMFYSYDACGATCANDHCGEENTYQDIESGNIVCESEYRNAWIKYRMATWIFILPLFCLVSSAMHYRRRSRAVVASHLYNYRNNGGGSPYQASSQAQWRGDNFGVQNNFTTTNGRTVYVVGPNGRLTPLHNSNANIQPQFYQQGDAAQEMRQQNQPRSGGMLDALFGRDRRNEVQTQSQLQNQHQQAPSVAEMAPVSREPTYAPPSNYYGNENQVRRNQAVTETDSQQQAYPTV